MVVNFWLRPGDAHSANNVLQFIESTLHHLGNKAVGLLRADSGFFDQAVFKLLEGKHINYIISARLTQVLQQAIIRDARWFALETGLELAEITYQANGWDCARRIVVVRQSIKRKNAPGKTLSLFADDPDIQGWRYGAMVTSLNLPAVEIWRCYRGRADCENRIKELKNDFGLDSFNLNSFYATEAALGFAMLAYNLMSVFRQAVMRAKIQPTLTTLHQQVLAVGAYWNRDTNQNQLLLAVSRRRRAWFEGLWANAGHPPVLPIHAKIG
jgi:pyridoxine 5'-phosphate synthase PdxJ